MAQQLEAPKGLLSRQALFPKQVLQGTPVAALGEGISSILSSVANALPDMPAPPGGAGLAPTPPLPGAAGLPRVTGFFKGIEASLPAGFPALSQVAQSLEGGGGNSPEAGPVIGGGFRSVAGKQVKILGGGYRSI